MTNFPTSLDALTNPTSTSHQNDAGVEHHLQHANANDAIEALQAKVGITNSAVTTSLDYLLKTKQGVVAFTSAPSTATSTGTAGTIIVQGAYLYVCVATNSWVRSAVSTW
jgi:hypothetical protein